MEENVKLIVSSSPHIRTKRSTQSIMLDVIIALIPALIAAIYVFGFRALTLTLVTVAACVLSEYLTQKAMKRPVRVKDLSAVVTGILLAFNLPSTFPYWMAIFGGVFAIVVVKEMFGGIGNNFMNPALAARAMLLTAWPEQMGNFVFNGQVSQSTPLTGKPVDMMSLFLGNTPGVLGEVSKLAILLGAAYLIYRNVISLKMPLTYIGTTALLLFLLKYDLEDTLMQILSGGLFLGAFFMLNDYSTCPMTSLGQTIYAIGAAVITTVIRLYGGYPEGVSYGILIMNIATPLLDKYIKPKTFGGAKE